MKIVTYNLIYSIRAIILCLHAAILPGVGSAGDLADAARPASARPPHGGYHVRDEASGRFPQN